MHDDVVDVMSVSALDVVEIKMTIQGLNIGRDGGGKAEQDEEGEDGAE